MSLRKRGPYHPDHVVVAARDLLVAGWQPTEIHRALHQRFDPHEVPPISTVQRWCRSWRYEDESGEWHPISAEPSMAERLLDTLKDLVEASEGGVISYTNNEAHNVNWLRIVRPDLNAVMGWYIARYYAYRTAHDESTRDLDFFVAIAPWRDQSEWTTYRNWTVFKQWVPQAPGTLRGMAEFRAKHAVDDPLTMSLHEPYGAGWIAMHRSKLPTQNDRRHYEKRGK